MPSKNPFFQPWDTLFQVPPFGLINNAHFAPAFDEAFIQSRAAINAIVAQDAAPTFENTIEAMERADTFMDRLAGVFHNLVGAHSNETLESLQRDLAPRWAAFDSETMMNAELFARIQTLVDTAEDLSLTNEQARVLELYHRMFIRAGAALKKPDQTRLAAVTQRLAELGTEFTQNLLADERDWMMELTESDLARNPGSSSVHECLVFKIVGKFFTYILATINDGPTASTLKLSCS